MIYDDGGFFMRETMSDRRWPECANCENDVAAGSRYCFECEAELEEVLAEGFVEDHGDA